MALVCSCVAGGLLTNAADGRTGETAAGAKKARKCKSSEVRKKISYRRPKGGPVRTVSACGPRSVAAPVTVAAGVAAMHRATRKVSVALAPRKVARLRRGRAARKLLKTDAQADAGLGSGLSARTARASKVTRDEVTQTSNRPAGTQTVTHRVGTAYDDDEAEPGRELVMTVDSRSNRIAGASSSKSRRVELVERMARCPDAGGVSRGRLQFSDTERHVMARPGGGRGVIAVSVRFDGRLTAQFDDSATIASVVTTGEYRWTTSTTLSGRTVSEHTSRAPITGTRLGTPRGDAGTRSVDFSTGVQTADDAMATPAGFLDQLVATMMPEFFAADLLADVQRRAQSGKCVRIVPDPPEVRVAAGGRVEIGARLNDYDGNEATGLVRIGSTSAGGTVLPGEADAGPRASFTYVALPSTPSGSRDVVTLAHRSKRGVARSNSVTVVYEIPPSHSYRVLAAELRETITGDRPGSSLGSCPDFHSEQVNAMTLGVQAPPAAQPGSNGHLVQGPDGWLGQITATGPSSQATTLRGCDLAGIPPTSCPLTGAGTIARDVGFDMTLPNSGPATLRWRFESFPTAGLGSEGAGTSCLAPPMGWSTEGDFSAGERSVPRERFEATTPQTLSVDIVLDVTDPNPAGAARIHAVERYSLTIQRVKDDGSPL